ncbi:LptF/LptG family permease [Phenylobacterium sp.]|jgi:lipopolysaccharide export system permease protein|uniref:LptF/LptG family permease n=1 Tax=Phenylobacterium sp. TaxID=1871053 RepID=UPI002F95A1A2
MTGHITKVVGFQILAALLVLVGVLQVLDLLDVTTEIVQRQLGPGGVAWYSLLRLPRLVEQSAPLAVLAGALFGFTRLARNSEVTAMRAAGMSGYRLTAMALPLAGAMMLAQLLMSTLVAPAADQTLARWWRDTAPAAQRAATEPRTFRIGTDIVVATPSPTGAERLDGVTIYRRTPDGQLIQTIAARTAVYRDGAWALAQPQVRTVAPGQVQTGSASELLWRTDLAPAEVEAIFSQTQISPGVAVAALEGAGSVRPRSYYQTQLQRFAADPIACVVMLLLAVPVALANFRSGRGGVTLVICLAAGLLFLVIDGVFTAIGESGLAPAWLAAWAAPVLFSAAGVSALLNLEG